MNFDVSLKVVDCGEAPPTAFKLAGVRPLLVMGLKMPFQFIGGGKGPAASLHSALKWAWVLCMVQEVNLEFLTSVKRTGAVWFWAGKSCHSVFL